MVVLMLWNTFALIKNGVNSIGRIANHNSHIDFILIWASIPANLRMITRPVVRADYWLSGKLKSFLIRDVFNAVLIDRERSDRTIDPIQQMSEALTFGDSIIIFTEGARKLTEEKLLPFNRGIYHFAASTPEVECVPMWIENLDRARNDMPALAPPEQQ